MGSKRQVDGLDEEIIEVSLKRQIGEKLFQFLLGFMAVYKVPGFEDKLVPFEGRRR